MKRLILPKPTKFVSLQDFHLPYEEKDTCFLWKAIVILSMLSGGKAEGDLPSKRKEIDVSV